MRCLPAPEGLPCESELRLPIIETLPPERRTFFGSERPVEMRPALSSFIQGADDDSMLTEAFLP